MHAIGGIETLVHVCVTILPTIPISEFIGELKRASSHQVNHQNPTRDKILQWQSGYSVVSFGTKDLQWVKNYVRNQRQHHARGTVYDRLECITVNESLVKDG